jgi:hypothetical protein
MQWNAIAGAENYEILIATDYLFATPVVEKTGESALPTTAWQCDISLPPDTTYYWKIRAAGAASYSPWSNTGVFITEPAPVVQVPPITETTITVVTTSPEITQPPTTTLPTEVPVITTTVPSTTSVPNEPSSPEWAKRLFYLGGAILAVMLGLLISVVIMLVRINRD